MFRPNTCEGRLPRYALLKRSSGSLRFLPIRALPANKQAYASEGLIIRYVDPICNRADSLRKQMLAGNVVQLKQKQMGASSSPASTLPGIAQEPIRAAGGAFFLRTGSRKSSTCWTRRTA